MSWSGLRPCPWSDCWCKAEPPARVIPSIDMSYSMEEIEPGLFRYVYFPIPPVPPTRSRNG